MDDWKLLDFRMAIEQESDAPVTRIVSAQQLRELLHEIHDDFPGLVILRAPGGEELKIGMGAESGYLFWGDRRSGAVAYARNDLPPTDEDFASFVAEGVTEEVPADQVLPIESVLDAGVEFYQRQELSNRLSWRIWDATMKTWSERPRAGR
jgi:hypothetical protein